MSGLVRRFYRFDGPERTEGWGVFIRVTIAGQWRARVAELVDRLLNAPV